MPIIHNEKIACSLNEYAKNNKVLIIVKIHPSQDISKISEFNYSNLIFIKNDFFEDKDITNYQLLGSCDALISDYSSVYYDYLLADKPIGLCFEDFDEYNEREGFTLDPNLILAGGVKIYNCDDMCDFISDIANGNDILKDKRNEIKNLVHSNTDNLSTKRVVDYLEKVVL
jgi:CDP-glycerol glycerophosphotransferase (TagB/SpsB family)